MRMLIAIIPLMLLFPMTLFAQEPIINSNVHVLRNVTPAQCPSNWKGQAGDVVQQFTSGVGEQNNMSAAIQSCTNCAFDSASGDCVCQTCYTNAE